MNRSHSKSLFFCDDGIIKQIYGKKRVPLSTSNTLHEFYHPLFLITQILHKNRVSTSNVDVVVPEEKKDTYRERERISRELKTAMHAILERLKTK